MIPVKGYAAQDPQTDLAPWNFERREVGPHDVQFDILFCGVCHSDLHQIKNDWFPGIFPMVPGHEIVGRVVKVGDKVTKFKVGDRVGTRCMVYQPLVCENCKQDLEQYCLNGSSQTYNGVEQDARATKYALGATSTILSEDFTLHISDKLD